MTLKQLPIGDQSLAKIIDQNLLYADKTRYIHELFRSSENHCFLSRPRRFGKTLLLRTIMELASGERSRFLGLWLDGPESGCDFPRHPVLSLSLSMESYNPEILRRTIVRDLAAIAREANLDIEDGPPASFFGDLITALHRKSGSEVVVLVDEYDAPVTRNMENETVAKANAKVLHDFFATLKKR